jgi:hypothetical protein
MQPSQWGSHVWFAMHYAALRYPQTPTFDQKQAYYEFYISLKNVLPCKKCRVHYTEILERLPLSYQVLENRHKLFSWTVEVHNIVNKSLNKPTITLEEALSIYENGRTQIKKKHFVKPILDACMKNNTVCTGYDGLIGLIESSTMIMLLLGVMVYVKHMRI